MGHKIKVRISRIFWNFDLLNWIKLSYELLLSLVALNFQRSRMTNKEGKITYIRNIKHRTSKTNKENQPFKISLILLIFYSILSHRLRYHSVCTREIPTNLEFCRYQLCILIESEKEMKLINFHLHHSTQFNRLSRIIILFTDSILDSFSWIWISKYFAKIYSPKIIQSSYRVLKIETNNLNFTWQWLIHWNHLWVLTHIVFLSSINSLISL